MSTSDPPIVIPILVAAFALAGLLAWFLVKAIKAFLANSEPYREAVLRARSDPRVLDALGAPIQAGLPQGNIRWDILLENRASLIIPMSGPMASGHLYVRARGRWRSWNYTQMQLNIESRGESIDLNRPHAQASSA